MVAKDSGPAVDLSPSERVVAAVAARKDVDPVDLVRPLDDVIDPDALDALFAPRSDGQPRGTGRVLFRYYGYQVTVTHEGAVDLVDVDDTDDGPREDATDE